MEATDIDRSEVARALAKAIAYKQCGKHADSAAWAERLVRLLDNAGILKDSPSVNPRDLRPTPAREVQ